LACAEKVRKKAGGLGRRLARSLLSLVFFSALIVASARAQTQTGPDSDLSDPDSIEVHVGQGRILRLGEDAANVMIANSGIADVQAVTNQVYYLYGHRPGLTTLTATNAKNGVTAQLRILVTRSGQMAQVSAPGDTGSVSFQFLNDRLVVAGPVHSLGAALDAEATAKAFGGGQQPLDRTQLEGAQQVTLRVRIAEVSRSSLNELGISLDVLAKPGSFAFGLVSGGLLGVAAGAASAVAGTGGSSGSSGGTSGSAVSGTSNFANVGIGVSTARVDASSLLNALESEGLMTSLAEPNLTTVSGETATFLSGGQVPIPVPQGLGTTAIEYKDYGVQLSFTPILLPGDRIAMDVNPQVSEISAGTSYTINGSSVPAFLTRSVQTTVEMASGQTLAIAGLFQRVDQQSLSKFPFLGDLPIIGAIFRSSSYQHDETELVILVTPYVSQPLSSTGAFPLPTDRPPSPVATVDAGFAIQ
jgi:pilus assembly protein CpaC